MVKHCRQTSWSSLWVSRGCLTDFTLSSWQSGASPLPMLLLRLLLCAGSLAIVVSALWDAEIKFWFIYLTNWGLIMLMLLTISAVVVSVVAACSHSPPPESDRLPWYVSAYWLLFNINVTVALLISLLYWTLLYSADLDPRDGFWVNFAGHALNAAVVLSELLAARTPVRLLHAYQPLGFGMWYIVFTIVYFVAGGTDTDGLPYIYDVLNWERRGAAASLAALSLLGLVLLYAGVFGAAWARDRLSCAFVRGGAGPLADSELGLR